MPKPVILEIKYHKGNCEVYFNLSWTPIEHLASFLVLTFLEQYKIAKNFRVFRELENEEIQIEFRKPVTVYFLSYVIDKKKLRASRQSEF